MLTCRVISMLKYVFTHFAVKSDQLLFPELEHRLVKRIFQQPKQVNYYFFNSYLYPRLVVAWRVSSKLFSSCVSLRKKTKNKKNNNNKENEKHVGSPYT